MRLSQMTMWSVSILFSFASAHAESLLLWNKLGSDSEVLNSAFGPDGAIVGSNYAYEPGMFGNGYVRKAVGDNYLEFPASIADQLRSRGAIELWINPKVSHPEPYSYGVFGLVGTPYGWAFLPSHPSDGGFVLAWGDGVTLGNGLAGYIKFDDQGAGAIEPSPFVATPGTPFHAALTWDIAGINGTLDKIRVYRDGNLVATTSDSWNPAGAALETIVLGYGPDSGGYDKFIVDNLKIWDYPKVDYSDRFVEAAGVIPEPGTFGLMAIGLAAVGLARNIGVLTARRKAQVRSEDGAAAA